MKLHNRKPDIDNLYKVLRREVPARPTLFEFFMNPVLYEALTGRAAPSPGDDFETLKFEVEAFAAAGYDYTTTSGSEMTFTQGERERKGTISLNDGYVIIDEESFENYQWPEPENCDYSRLEKITPYLPDGMKLLVKGPGGVLENVMGLVGYDNLCIMLYENPALAARIFDEVGSRLVQYYRISAQFDSVGVVISNDDWGFNTQTFLSPELMHTYLFPWHRKIVQTIHDAGHPALLHSCGFFGEVIDDVVALGYDAKHSYEDVILPVEDSYEAWHDKIAVLGGIDLDFLIRSSEADITARCRGMLDRAANRGGYALGTGNSVPEYVPLDKYFAMIRSALEY